MTDVEAAIEGIARGGKSLPYRALRKKYGITLVEYHVLSLKDVVHTSAYAVGQINIRNAVSCQLVHRGMLFKAKAQKFGIYKACQIAHSPLVKVYQTYEKKQ